ncbi:unnamed protein product [Ixodes hexagonus]
MAAQLDRLQQVYPVSVRQIKERLHALRKPAVASQGRRTPLAVRHETNSEADDPGVAEDAGTNDIPDAKKHERGDLALGGAQGGITVPPAVKRPSRKPSPPPPPVRPPEGPEAPHTAGSPDQRTTKPRTSRHRSMTPPSRSRGASPVRRRSPSPAPEYPPGVMESIRRRVLQVRRGARLYLLCQPGPHSFLVAADQPDHRFKVVVGPQTCTCGKAPLCVHLLFVMLRVLKVRDSDPRLFSKTLKNYEVDELLRAYSAWMRRSSLQSEGGSSDLRSPEGQPPDLSEEAKSGVTKEASQDAEEDEKSTCPICLLEMFEGESLVSCERGCRNRLHHHCIAIWAQECSRNGDPVLCPLCRCCWKEDCTSPPDKLVSSSSEEDIDVPAPPCPLHCLLRRASDAPPLPRPVGANTASTSTSLLARFFGAEVALCMASASWSEREAAIQEVEAQVTHALRLALANPSCLDPWGGVEVVQAACCQAVAAGVADPVYRVYVTALRCLKSMLVHSPCHILEDLRSLQSRVRNIVRAILIKCASGGNKRSRQLSLATLAELAKGQTGALSVGSLTNYPAPDGLGADFLLEVVLFEGKLTPTWQGLLSQLLVLRRLAEEFPRVLSSPIIATGTSNADSIVAVDLAVRALGHSHTTVVRHGRDLLASLARICGRCPTTVAHIWDGVASLQGHLRTQLVRRVGAALQETRNLQLVFAQPPQERLQEANLVREKLLHNGMTRDSRGGSKVSSPGCQSPHSASPSRMPTFQLPPPSIDPELFHHLLPNNKLCAESDQRSRSSTPQHQSTATQRRLCSSPSLERRLRESLFSSGRSSWSSNSSDAKNDSTAETKRSAPSPPLAGPPPRALRGHRPNFLPLHRLASSLSLGHTTSSSQTSPGSVGDFGSPVSFAAEIEALSRENGDVPSKEGVTVNPGSPISTTGITGCGDMSPSQCNAGDMRDEEFIVFRPLSELAMCPSRGEDGRRRYAEGEHWRRGPLLGSGAFSSCYQAVDIKAGTLLAVKQMSFCRNCREEEDSVVASMWDEIQMMARLGHPNVLPLLGATRRMNHYNVFVQWMAGGSVASMLDRYGPFSESVILRYTHQVLGGLSYLHQNHILHRDLKGANLLVDGTGRHLKIADFGSASRLSSKATLAGEFQGQLLGTISFMAPEVLRGEDYGRSCDIWSVGCVMIEMATNAHPWSEIMAPNHLALMYRISCARSPPPMPESLSLPTQHLMLRCLQLRSQDRPPAGDLLSHPCFRRVGLCPEKDP